MKQTKRSLALHRAALEKAQAEYDAAKAAYEQDKKRVKTPAKERISDVHSELLGPAGFAWPGLAWLSISVALAPMLRCLP